MSFGSIGSMHTILKNKRNLLSNSKREKFKNGIGGYDKNRKTEFDLPNAKPHVLHSVKANVIAQQKIREKKIIIIFSIVFISLVSLFLYWIT